MASVDPTVLTKDVWTKVLTNVTYKGQVHILDQDEEPTNYLVAFVNTGDPAPAVAFSGGIKIQESFSPANTVASDYYIKPEKRDGLVEILI
jgi:hypothetical protein